MTFDEAYKIYRRFLKDEGIFTRTLKIHSHSKFGAAYGVEKCLLIVRASRWIQNSAAFCAWCRSSEGEKFWWPISILWQIKCLQNNIILDDFYEDMAALKAEIAFNVKNYLAEYKTDGITGKMYYRLMEYKKENNI